MTITAAQADRARHGIANMCATASDEEVLLRGLSARLEPLLGYDAACWLVTDPQTTLFTDGRIEAFQKMTCQPWFDNELLTDDVNKFTQLARGKRTAVLSHTVDPTTSARWTELMRPVGLDAELRSAFADATGCWGVVELHRDTGRRDFTADEAALVDSIGGTVAAALRRIAVERSAVEAVGADGPGLWFVSDDGYVRGATEAGEAWLALIANTSGDADSRASLHALAAVVRDGADRHPRHVRLRAADGRWVTLHASPRTDGQGTAVIVEPAQTHEIAAVLSLAYGLSERERQVVTAVARGATTDDIATQLFISTHTVRDHLKSAFTKVGVSSRTELIARLFTDHYAHRLFGSAHT